MKPFFIILVCSFSFTSFACSCEDIPFKNAVEWADEIFLGRVIEVKEVEYETSPQDPEYKYTRLWYAKFEVIQKWKGSSKKYVTIYQPSTSCDAGFDLSGNYLVYSKKERIFNFFNTENRIEALTTWLCSRSRQYLYVNEKKDSDYFKLNTLFKDEIKLYNNVIFNWKNLLISNLLILTIFFIGYKNRKNKTVIL